MKVKVVGTQIARADLSGLRSGMPVRLVHQPENAVDGNCLLVLRAGADPHAVRLAMRQNPDVQEGLWAAGLSDKERRERIRAYAVAVPGFMGYLERELAATRIGAEVRAGLWQATIHSVPRFGDTLGVRLSLEKVTASPAALRPIRDQQACSTDNRGVRT